MSRCGPHEAAGKAVQRPEQAQQADCGASELSCYSAAQPAPRKATRPWRRAGEESAVHPWCGQGRCASCRRLMSKLCGAQQSHAIQRCGYAGDVVKIPLEQLQRDIGQEKGMWLYRMARGHDGESVTPRTAPKSIGCGKTFRGHLLIKSTDKVPF